MNPSGQSGNQAKGSGAGMEDFRGSPDSDTSREWRNRNVETDDEKAQSVVVNRHWGQ
jgi:hypothetical protein